MKYYRPLRIGEIIKADHEIWNGKDWDPIFPRTIGKQYTNQYSPMRTECSQKEAEESGQDIRLAKALKAIPGGAKIALQAKWTLSE